MGKKFGLREAQILAGEPGAHLPTVKATLLVLGVKNVVGQQVSRLVTGAKGAIAQAKTATAALLANDASDERHTVKQIGDLRTTRDGRAKANAEAMAGNGRAISSHQEEIARLEELAKKFA